MISTPQCRPCATTLNKNEKKSVTTQLLANTRKLVKSTNNSNKYKTILLGNISLIDFIDFTNTKNFINADHVHIPIRIIINKKKSFYGDFACHLNWKPYVSIDPTATTTTKAKTHNKSLIKPVRTKIYTFADQFI